MRGYLGGYSNLERATDAALDNSAHVVTLLEAAAAAANASGRRLQRWPGRPASGPQSLDESGIPAAVGTRRMRRTSPLLVLGDGGEAVGYDSSVSCGEGADRPSLDLPGVQVRAAAAVE